MTSYPVAPFGGFGGYGSETPMWTGAPWTGGNFGGAMTPFGGVNTGFDSSFKAMDREFHDMQKWMDRRFSNIDHRRPSYTNELTFHPSRPANFIEHYSLLNPIRIDADGNRWLNCYFDLRSFKPEEINVTLDSKNRCVCVEANHEVKDAKNHYIKRSYSRKVYVPEELKIDLSKIDLKSCLTNEGLLCIEAALPKLTMEEARATSATGKAMSTVNPTVCSIPVKTI